jgi:dihydrolipoamide dehydrogenase
LGPEKIEVKSTEHGARSIEGKLILATGSLPTPLPGITNDGLKFLSSDDILDLTTVPEQLDIVGSGVIGLHFAMIYSALGTKVTIYEILPEILPGVDEEIVALVKRLFKRKKIELKTGTAFNPADSCGKTLICVGRHPNLTGLEKLNLEMDGRRVRVNDRLETSLPGIYAVGDLVSLKQFAHVGYEQGVIAAENALGKERRFTYDFVPYTIYTQPEIAAVGLTEKQAREKYGEIKVGKFPLGALGIAQAMGEIEGFVKFVCTVEGKILGAHIVGAEASALISAAVLAIKNGLTIEQVAETFQSHPSYPEGLQEAAEAVLKRALHS